MLKIRAVSSALCTEREKKCAKNSQSFKWNSETQHLRSKTFYPQFHMYCFLFFWCVCVSMYVQKF